MNENVIKMARIVGGCKDRTCEDCLSRRKKLFGDNRCALIDYAETFYKAGYRKQEDTVKEFAERVLKDITDAINHNARIMESSRNLNHANYHNALIANNACKGIYDVITAIAKEFGVEDTI